MKSIDIRHINIDVTRELNIYNDKWVVLVSRSLNICWILGNECKRMISITVTAHEISNINILKRMRIIRFTVEKVT